MIDVSGKTLAERINAIAPPMFGAASGGFFPAGPQRGVDPGFLTMKASVPAGAVVEVIRVPRVLFRARRLVVAPSCARDIEITQIRVGHLIQGDDLAPWSGELFPPLPFELSEVQLAAWERMNEWRFDTCAPTTEMRVFVRSKLLRGPPIDVDICFWGFGRES